MLAHFRQLFRQEGQAFRRLGRFALNVLFQIISGNAVENVADLIAVFASKAQAEHAGIFAVFDYRQVVLQVIDHP